MLAVGASQARSLPVSHAQEASFGIEGGTTHGFNLRTAVASVVRCNWGDGAWSTQVCGPDADTTFSHTYAAPYTGRIKLGCSHGVGKIIYFLDFTGDCLERFTAEEMRRLRGLLVYSNGKAGASFSGNIRDLPRSLAILHADGEALSGNVSDLPPACWMVLLRGANTLSGDIADIPPGAGLVLEITGQNTLSGDLADIKTDVVHWKVTGDNTIDAYSGPLWRATGLTHLTLNGPSCGMPSNQVDQLLIDIAGQSPLPANGVIDLSAGNQARTATSASAVTTLVTAGWTVLTA